MGSTAELAPRAAPETHRRSQILAAAGRAFVRKGYHGTTVRDIAAEAGLAPGTLYLYFAGKHDILTGFFDEVISGAEARMDGLASLPLQQALETFVRERLEALRELGDVVKVTLSEALYDEELRARFEQHVLPRTRRLLAQLLQQHGIATVPKARLDMIAQALQAQIIYWGVLRPALEPSVPRDPAREARAVCSLMMDGIRGLFREAQPCGQT